eukprot:CAMPEP_0114426830 /NCGR_PEP_ID=MMETSP0103-20121206/8012_1 /TAXON_ID=37642 ORGANISM="Paraphysomonas imperforata, Strain PA2" /NCGR_SAMPLE_ID=MMETSP0103 /ASSEMBLY_ACC=CAM_ASM_000201 /LENGTH=312 /DNA_ID=CAMNT_0001595827 /DNA_START=21 /DNA_END=959 /DNA_ORIENTATION=+
MKLYNIVPYLSVLSYGLGADVDCPEKTDSCKNRVKVSVTDMIQGLKDDIPSEVISAFVETSAECMQCVDTSDVKAFNTGDDTALTWAECRNLCWCCRNHHCQDEDGNHQCPAQCFDWFSRCDFRRFLTEDEPMSEVEAYTGPGTLSSSKPAIFEIDVCMDDIAPLDMSKDSYLAYDKMLADFEEELTQCYSDKDEFYESWASRLSQQGIDLTHMTRNEGGSSVVMFGAPAIDKEGAEVTTYSSDNSHEQTSNKIFYGAMGFAAVTAFAIFGTAVVVKKLNARQAANDEQANRWIAEMTAADGRNPLTTQQEA